jgi:hypothetical protein
VRTYWRLFSVALLFAPSLAPCSSAQQQVVSGPPQFAPPVWYRFPIPYSTGIASGDLTGNGISDLMGVSPDTGSVEVRLGKGDGTFGPLLYSNAGNSPSVITPGRFDGKNLDAIVNDTEYGEGLVLLGDGQGKFP